MTRFFPIWQTTDHERLVPLMLVIAAHLIFIAWLINNSMRPEPSLALPAMTGILVAPPAPQPVAVPSRPKAVPSRPQPSLAPPIEAPPTERSISMLPEVPEPRPVIEPETETLTPVLPAAAPVAAETAIAPAPVIPPRVDAAHLNNPVPAYPPLSRKLGEQGQVVFDIYILADGTVGEIKLKTSSGFSRLDAAAREAVQRWRYVPARRGDVAIAFWYAQPVSFSLRNSQTR